MSGSFWEKYIVKNLETFGATAEAAAQLSDIYAAIVLTGWEQIVEHGESKTGFVYGASEVNVACIHAAMCTKSSELGEMYIRTLKGGVPIPQLIGQFHGTGARPKLVWNSRNTGILQFNSHLLQPTAESQAFEERKRKLLDIIPSKIEKHNKNFHISTPADGYKLSHGNS